MFLFNNLLFSIKYKTQKQKHLTIFRIQWNVVFTIVNSCGVGLLVSKYFLYDYRKAFYLHSYPSRQRPWSLLDCINLLDKKKSYKDVGEYCNFNFDFLYLMTIYG